MMFRLHVLLHARWRTCQSRESQEIAAVVSKSVGIYVHSLCQPHWIQLAVKILTVRLCLFLLKQEMDPEVKCNSRHTL